MHANTGKGDVYAWWQSWEIRTNMPRIIPTLQKFVSMPILSIHQICSQVLILGVHNLKIQTIYPGELFFSGFNYLHYYVTHHCVNACLPRQLL